MLKINIIPYHFILYREHLKITTKNNQPQNGCLIISPSSKLTVSIHTLVPFSSYSCTPPQPQQSSNPETQAPGHRIAPISRILSFVLLTNEHKIYIIQKQMNTNNWEYRRSVIISAVEVQGTVSVAELAERLGVTETTIRRDLTELEHEGVVKRVHGGVVSARGRSYEPTLMLRTSIHVDEKKRIGQRAASLVMDGDCIALDVGSTTREVAQNLVRRRNLTVITPSLLIATTLVNQPDLRLVVPGGIVRPGETSMVGELAQRAFEIFHVDRLFLGVGGIDASAGLTEYNWDDTLVKQAMLKTAKEVVVVADSSKFDRIATVNIAPLDVVDKLITDLPPSPQLAQALKDAGVTVIVA